MFLLVCANALQPPRATCRLVASSQIVACASQPRHAVVLITDVDAPEPAALDMVTTLRSQGWAVRLASSSAGASAALAEDPQAVFELQRSGSSFALQEECEARQACLYRWQPASATFKRQAGGNHLPSHISPAPSFEAEAERRGWGFLDLSGLHEDERDEIETSQLSDVEIARLLGLPPPAPPPDASPNAPSDAPSGVPSGVPTEAPLLCALGYEASRDEDTALAAAEASRRPSLTRLARAVLFEGATEPPRSRVLADGTPWPAADGMVCQLHCMHSPCTTTS